MPFFGQGPRPDRPDGVPGLPEQEGMSPELGAMLLTRSADAPMIGKKEIQRATELLKKYKDGKAALEQRVVDDELWWALRHWEAIRKEGKGGKPGGPEPTSAWLFNAIANHHADAMDNYPEPIVLPREQSDEESARTLSEVLPVILEVNDFEQTYSDAWWEKLKHGTAAYGVFWNTQKENGLGDIDIRAIDLLKLFWEPGITDVQESANLFICELVDEDALKRQYPQLSQKSVTGNAIDLAKYVLNDNVDTSQKALVVDWYYKVKGPDGRTVLHYVKFVGEELLYASENDPTYAQRGYYDHGLYPVVLDVLYPEKGTPVGFGLVAICKDPQLYIDKLSANILETSLIASKTRYFASENLNINDADLLDVSKPLVKVSGEIDDRRLREIAPHGLDGIYVNVLQMKIEEMKDTASNRDVNSGSSSGGVTAASAIAALQEAGNKSSRDMIKTSYRANRKIAAMCIELIRQFYDEARAFRITAPDGGDYQFVSLSNAQIKDQDMGLDSMGVSMYRRPVFDLKIRAQKQNPFSRMEQNERAKELYGMGFFNPENAQQSLMALDMMDFEGVDKVRARVQEGQTLLNMVQQLQAQVALLQAAIGRAPTAAPVAGGGSIPSGGTPVSAGVDAAAGKTASMSDRILQAHTPMTSYGDRLARRSTPDMEGR